MELLIGAERRRAYSLCDGSLGLYTCARAQISLADRERHSEHVVKCNGTHTRLYLVEKKQLLSNSEYFQRMFEFPGTEAKTGVFTLDFMHDFDAIALLQGQSIYRLSNPRPVLTTLYGRVESPKTIAEIWHSVPLFRMFLRHLHGKNYYISSHYDDQFFSHFITYRLFYELKLYLFANRILNPTFMKSVLFSAWTIIRDRGPSIFPNSEAIRQQGGQPEFAEHYVWACIEILYYNMPPQLSSKHPDGMKVLFAKLYSGMRHRARNFKQKYGERCVQLGEQFPEFVEYAFMGEMHEVWGNIRTKRFWEKLVLNVGELGCKEGGEKDLGEGVEGE